LSEAEWRERVRARIEESVRMQMVSDVPIVPSFRAALIPVQSSG
jgi:asparagine synthetase B (glutamine-hydrolysing)